MSTSHIPDELLDKLNKLKNMADGAAAIGSTEEASNAAAKFQALLLKHNLDEASVLEHGIKRKAQMLESEIESDEEWTRVLIVAVASHCMCANIKNRGTNKYKILGEKVNVAVCEYMIEQLYNKILAAAELTWFKDKKKMHISQKNFKEGFYMGCVDEIATRLRTEEKKAVAANTEMGLMVINKKALAERFMLDKYPNVVARTYRVGTDNPNEAYIKGREAGGRMELNKGLASRSGQAKLE